ncbi:MAG: 23S rRNA (guanosine(2251)-2'-O)-methyltransferase RlmB [Oligoflexia bacterium]|nr:23S rRNA (guanosine(2251)-2'-O)-methyltransferase RlmB [Oligoflexia bacterium]
MIAIGVHSIEACLEAGLRVLEIHYLAKAEQNRGVEIRKLAEKKNIKWKEYALKDKLKFEQVLKSKADGGSVNADSAQGIFAEVFIDEVSHLDLLKKAQNEQLPIIIYLDGITDPQNLGSILRSSAFFNVLGVVVPESRSSPLTPAAIKISSGGFAYVPVVRVPNLARAMEDAKEQGLWFVGFSEHEKNDLSTVRVDGPLGLIIGNEEKGMRELTKKNCDFLVSLEGQGKVKSLNASVATAVALSTIRNMQRV